MSVSKEKLKVVKLYLKYIKNHKPILISDGSKDIMSPEYI